MSIERAAIVLLLFVIGSLLIGEATIEVTGACLVMGLLFGLVIGVTLKLDKPSNHARN